MEYEEYYHRAEELIFENMRLIEVLSGYCESTVCDYCNSAAILSILCIMRKNQDNILNAIEKCNLLLLRDNCTF